MNNLGLCELCKGTSKRAKNKARFIVNVKKVCKKHKNFLNQKSPSDLRKPVTRKTFEAPLNKKYEYKIESSYFDYTVKVEIENGVFKHAKEFTEGRPFTLKEIRFDSNEQAERYAEIIKNLDTNLDYDTEPNLENFFYQDSEDKEKFAKQVQDILDNNEFIGSGQSRAVYDDGEYVLKVALSEEGVFSNKSEVNTTLPSEIVAPARKMKDDYRIIRMRKVIAYDFETEEREFDQLWEDFQVIHKIGFDEETEDISDGGQVGFYFDENNEYQVVLYDYPSHECPKCSQPVYGRSMGFYCTFCLLTDDN